MSLTIRILLRFLRQMTVFGVICMFCYLQYYLIINFDRIGNYSIDGPINIGGIILLDMLVLFFGIVVFFAEGYNIKIWNKLNMLCIDNIDPTIVKIYDFINRKNGGCKE